MATQTSKRSAVIMAFADRSQAEKAVSELRNMGFDNDQVQLYHSGFLDALFGHDRPSGLSEAEAQYFTSELDAGRTLVIVHSGDRYDEIVSAMRRYGAYDMNSGSSSSSTSSSTMDTSIGSTRGTSSSSWESSSAGSTGAAHAARSATTMGDTSTRDHKMTGTEDTLRLHEEQLSANKERVQAGEVRLGKEVIEEQKTINVPVTHEEVYIERRPVNREVTGEAIGAEDRTISVPVMDERVNVQKQTVVTEEVGIGKHAVTENKQVSDTVRREELKVEKQGDLHTADVDMKTDTSKKNR